MGITLKTKLHLRQGLGVCGVAVDREAVSFTNLTFLTLHFPFNVPFHLVILSIVVHRLHLEYEFLLLENHVVVLPSPPQYPNLSWFAGLRGQISFLVQ
jgi:hypothetical protein